jgi:exoribonuclease-2
VVRSPERWDRLAAVAAERGFQLPSRPDAQALETFLRQRRAADPDGFADLSLTVIKLLGRGEYAAERPDETRGHFALAVSNYTHSTAPNRRYPDLVTQRLVKATLRARALPYDFAALTALAAHCTKQEDAANKVERLVRKAAAALFLSRRIGDEFDAIVTGASGKGTWVRLRTPPIEGRLERGFEGLDVGDRVRVRLESTDAERGFIDFARA